MVSQKGKLSPINAKYPETCTLSGPFLYFLVKMLYDFTKKAWNLPQPHENCPTSCRLRGKILVYLSLKMLYRFIEMAWNLTLTIENFFTCCPFRGRFCYFLVKMLSGFTKKLWNLPLLMIIAKPLAPWGRRF